MAFTANGPLGGGWFGRPAGPSRLRWAIIGPSGQSASFCGRGEGFGEGPRSSVSTVDLYLGGFRYRAGEAENGQPLQPILPAEDGFLAAMMVPRLFGVQFREKRAKRFGASADEKSSDFDGGAGGHWLARPANRTWE